MIHDSYDWIVNCIYSCTNEFQLECCKRLVELFGIQYQSNNQALSFSELMMDDIRHQEISISVTA